MIARRGHGRTKSEITVMAAKARNLELEAMALEARI